MDLLLRVRNRMQRRSRRDYRSTMLCSLPAQRGENEREEAVGREGGDWGGIPAVRAGTSLRRVDKRNTSSPPRNSELTTRQHDVLNNRVGRGGPRAYISRTGFHLT